MTEVTEQASAVQQALHPPPPAFYQLYRQDADGTAERPLPPEIPAPVQGEYQLFGEIFTVRLSIPSVQVSCRLVYIAWESIVQVEPGIPPLQTAPLYRTNAEGFVGNKPRVS